MGKGEAEGGGGGEGTRREDRPIFINLTGSLARPRLSSILSLGTKAEKRKAATKKRNYKTKQVQSIKLEEDRALGRNFKEKVYENVARVHRV